MLLLQMSQAFVTLEQCELLLWLERKQTVDTLRGHLWKLKASVSFPVNDHTKFVRLEHVYMTSSNADQRLPVTIKWANTPRVFPIFMICRSYTSYYAYHTDNQLKANHCLLARTKLETTKLLQITGTCRGIPHIVTHFLSLYFKHRIIRGNSGGAPHQKCM